MPKMNGYQVCRALADESLLKDVPVVLMSAKGDQVGERFVKVMGIVDYITKPFSPDAITAVVTHTIGKYARPQAGIGADGTSGSTAAGGQAPAAAEAGAASAEPGNATAAAGPEPVAAGTAPATATLPLPGAGSGVPEGALHTERLPLGDADQVAGAIAEMRRKALDDFRSGVARAVAQKLARNSDGE